MTYLNHIKIFLLSILLSACIGSKTKGTTNPNLKTLHGTWNFLASNEIDNSDLLKQNFKNWDTITVPGNWDTRERYATYKGKAYYQKNFTVPENWNKKNIRLKFGAVYQTANVWLNGEFLGDHVGGYLPFEFDITEKLKKNGSNSLIVMADNTIRRGAWWAWGGISRDVTLFADNEIRLVKQHITSIPDFTKNIISFEIKYQLENKSNTEKVIEIQSEIIDQEKLPRQQIAIPANASIYKTISFKRNIANYKLWNFNTPNLYNCKTEITFDAAILDSKTDHFGIRKFEVKGEQFFLNNIAVRMNGVNRVHDHPDYGNTEPDHLILKDLSDIKSLGCNFSRLMHAPLSENILDFCDKNGFLLIEEIPVWGEKDPNSVPNNPLTKEWMKDLVDRDYNHPSVVAWSVGNELRTTTPKWGEQHLTVKQYQYVNEMIDYVATIDSTRLKTYVSNTSYQGGIKGIEPFEKVDFLSVNSYGHALKIIEKVHNRFPNKPIFVSEIGKGQIGPAPNAVLDPNLIQWIKDLKNYPYITGVSLWSYNDYRSDYKGTPASGFREWGIVDEKRNKKKAYQQLKDAFAFWAK